VSLLSILASQKDIVLEKDIASGVPDCIITDSIRYNQILVNLISNAVKFTHKGQITVKLTYNAYHNILKTKVIDTGAGIKEEQLPTIFEAFNKADLDPTLLP